MHTAKGIKGMLALEKYSKFKETMDVLGSMLKPDPKQLNHMDLVYRRRFLYSLI